jgi:hypothetical protein
MLKNEYQLAAITKGNTYEEIADEIYEMVKNDPEYAANIIKHYVANIAEDVLTIKETVRLYESEKQDNKE